MGENTKKNRLSEGTMQKINEIHRLLSKLTEDKDFKDECEALGYVVLTNPSQTYLENREKGAFKNAPLEVHDKLLTQVEKDAVRYASLCGNGKSNSVSYADYYCNMLSAMLEVTRLTHHLMQYAECADMLSVTEGQIAAVKAKYTKK